RTATRRRSMSKVDHAQPEAAVERAGRSERFDPEELSVLQIGRHDAAAGDGDDARRPADLVNEEPPRRQREDSPVEDRDNPLVPDQGNLSAASDVVDVAE